MKRTVPREDMEAIGVFRTKKIFIGGIPQFFTGGIANQLPLPISKVILEFVYSVF